MFLGVALVVALGSTWLPIERGHRADHPIALTTRQYVRVCVVQRDIDLDLEMLDPSGQVVARAGAMEYGQDCLRAVAHQSGMYRLQIVPVRESTVRGEWRVVSIVRRPARVVDAKAIEAQGIFAAAMAKEGKPDLALREEALAGFTRALELAVTAGDRRLQAEILTHEANELHRLGRSQSADQAYREAASRWQRVADPTGLFLAQVEYQKLLGRLGHKEVFFTFAQETQRWRSLGDRRAEAYVDRRVCFQMRDSGRFEVSERAGKRAVEVYQELGDQEGEARTWEALAELYGHSGRHADQLSAMNRRLAIAEARGDTRGIAAALAGQGVAFGYLGRQEEAIAAHRRARTISLAIGDVSAAISNASSLAMRLVDLGRVREGVAVVEEALGESQILERQFADPLWQIGGGAHGLVDAYVRATSELALTERSGEAEDLALLKMERLKSRFVRAGGDPVRRPSADTVFLSYWLGYPGWLWVVTSDERHLFRLSTLGLEERVQALQDQMAGRSPEWRAHATELSKVLLTPVAPWLGSGRIVVSVHASLNTLPFAALPDPRPGHEDHLLGEDHEVVYVPSLLTRARLTPYRSPKSIAILADPIFDAADPRLTPKAVAVATDIDPELRAATRSVTGSSKLTRLVFSYREAMAIANLAGVSATAYMGFEATRERLFHRGWLQEDILHIATHGFYDSNRPDYSGIVLSLFDPKGKSQPGFVRLTDLLNRSISNQLIVLSACQTARGQKTRSEANLSLTSTLLRAGARSVVSSAWKIDDEATARFVEYFYEGLLKQNLAAPAALSAAQRRLRANPRWSHPYYWAAMMFHGEWENPKP